MHKRITPEQFVELDGWLDIFCHAMSLKLNPFIISEPGTGLDDDTDGFDCLFYSIISYLHQLPQSVRNRAALYVAIFNNDPQLAYRYAEDLGLPSWPEAEPLILTNAVVSYFYAKDVLKRRWAAAEPIILSDSYFSYLYAANVIKGKWPEAEPSISADKYLWGYYCNWVLSGRCSRHDQPPIRRSGIESLGRPR